MKKLSKFLLCLTLMLVSCFAMVGCGDNPPDTSGNDYQSAVINNSNYSNYLSLNSFLYYQTVNTDFYFQNMPCFDWCYKTGDINSELLGANVLTEDFTKPTTETFFSNNTTNIDKRWKVVSFKSLKDIKINSIEFTLNREQGIILNTYNVSFIITTNETSKEYVSSSNQTEGNNCKYTFTSFWYPDYSDIEENGYISLPKDSILTIVFNDTKLIKETYSEELSTQNGIGSPEYSTNEERAFALSESIKCFNISNLTINGQSK